MEKLQAVPSMWIVLGPVLLIVAITLALMLLTHPEPNPPNQGWRRFCYSNPADPALFVRKRIGFGYTLNLGNPWSWAVLAVITALSLAPFFFISAYLRHLLNIPSK
jgi:hypothetical protein